MIDEVRLLNEVEYYISHTNETSGEHYAYKQIKRLIEKQPKVMEWISCEIEMPNRGQNVMLMTHSGEVLIGSFMPGFGHKYKDVFICNNGIRKISEIKSWSVFHRYEEPEWRQRMLNTFLAENERRCED